MKLSFPTEFIMRDLSYTLDMPWNRIENTKALNINLIFEIGLTCLGMGNGQGKTTLMRQIAELKVSPTYDVVYSPQNIDDCLLEDRTMAENLACMFKTEGGNKSKGIVTEEMLKYPRELSGGQRRSLILRYILALDAQVFVLDEPFTFMDEVARSESLQILRAESRGAIVIVSDHVRLGYDSDEYYKSWNQLIERIGEFTLR